MFFINSFIGVYIYLFLLRCKDIDFQAQLQISVTYFCSIGLYFLV